MSKISEGLRKSASETFYDPLKSELNQAADHIDKLEAALQIYACKSTCENCYGSVRDTQFCGVAARKALEETCSD